MQPHELLETAKFVKGMTGGQWVVKTWGIGPEDDVVFHGYELTGQSLPVVVHHDLDAESPIPIQPMISYPAEVPQADVERSIACYWFRIVQFMEVPADVRAALQIAKERTRDKAQFAHAAVRRGWSTYWSGVSRGLRHVYLGGQSDHPQS